MAQTLGFLGPPPLDLLISDKIQAPTQASPLFKWTDNHTSEPMFYNLHQFHLRFSPNRRVNNLNHLRVEANCPPALPKPPNNLAHPKSPPLKSTRSDRDLAHNPLNPWCRFIWRFHKFKRKVVRSALTTKSRRQSLPVHDRKKTYHMWWRRGRDFGAGLAGACGSLGSTQLLSLSNPQGIAPPLVIPLYLSTALTFRVGFCLLSSLLLIHPTLILVKIRHLHLYFFISSIIVALLILTRKPNLFHGNDLIKPNCFTSNFRRSPSNLLLILSRKPNPLRELFAELLFGMPPMHHSASHAA